MNIKSDDKPLMIAGLSAAGLLALAFGGILGGTKYHNRQLVNKINLNKKAIRPYIGNDLNTPLNYEIMQNNKELHDQNAILLSRLAGFPGWLK